jgi:hypothetical protein
VKGALGCLWMNEYLCACSKLRVGLTGSRDSGK